VISNSDILIVGGGLAGKAMALCLDYYGIPSTIIEKSKVSSYQDDGRVIALSNGSIRMLKGLDLWQSLEPFITPIKNIHISIQGKFGSALIDADKEGVTELGCSIPIQKLDAALARTLEKKQMISLINSVEIKSHQINESNFLTLNVEVESKAKEFSPRLCIASDGMHSQIRTILGIESNVFDYQQTALTFSCTASNPKYFMAFERFTDQGALAVLPGGGDLYTVIWTLSKDHAERLISHSKSTIENELAKYFGRRMGSLKMAGPLFHYPLVQSFSQNIIKNNAVLIGSSALHLHPIAGQGYNLVLRDVAALAETLHDQGGALFKSSAISKCLDQYADWRKEDQSKVKKFTHFLASYFIEMHKFRASVLSKSIFLLDFLPMAKSMLSRHTMGLEGKTPRIMNGQS
jgi:2-octaprenyl-6-methoxyphenol hydroxylase